MRVFVASARLAVLLLATGQAIASNTPLQEAVNSDFAADGFSIWVSAMGDLNGDGLSDAALVLVGNYSGGVRSERLVVYLGTQEGSFYLLSRSDQFCEVRNFYNLDILRGALFVEMVHSVGEPISSTTLQFRLEPDASDLRLIGEEYREEHNQVNDTFRGSVNHLTGKAIYSRSNDLGRKETPRRREFPPVYLQGFECSEWNTVGSDLLIDEFLNIHE